MLSTSSTSAWDIAAAALRRLAAPARFVAAEIALFVSIYAGYLAVRSSSVGGRHEAVANARDLIALEHAAGLSHEAGLQHALSAAHGVFSAYYMLGFGPVIAGTLVWMATRRRDSYRGLRTALLVSIAIAAVGYVAYPAAPPRMVPELGITDTVGLSGSHDEGSFAGIRFNPYAAMPSMHVGWSLLIGIFGYKAARRRLTRTIFVAHPVMMAVTVTATGNHYFVDSLAGALVSLTALSLIYLATHKLPRLAMTNRLRPALQTLHTAAARTATAPARAARATHAAIDARMIDAGPHAWAVTRAGPADTTT